MLWQPSYEAIGPGTAYRRLQTASERCPRPSPHSAQLPVRQSSATVCYAVRLPELHQQLARRGNRWLYSRIHHRLAADDAGEDITEYVAYKLQLRGADKTIFAVDAVALMHEHAPARCAISTASRAAPCATPHAESANPSTAKPSNACSPGACRSTDGTMNVTAGIAIAIWTLPCQAIDGHSRFVTWRALTRCLSSSISSRLRHNGHRSLPRRAREQRPSYCRQDQRF